MNKILEERYAEVLADIDPSFLDHEVAKSRKLSTPFLVSGPLDPGARKIMVIGREFGGDGWRIKCGGGPMLYVTEALNRHRVFYSKQMAKKKMDRGVTFFNFMRTLGARFGHEGLIYSNLLCIDSEGKDPSKSEHFSSIKLLSKRLLDVQLDCFKPDAIIFANGASTVSVRREFFPINGKDKVCKSLRNWEEYGIAKDHLWEFELLDKFRCYRIQHPATVKGRVQAEAARRHLLEVLAI